MKRGPWSAALLAAAVAVAPEGADAPGTPAGLAVDELEFIEGTISARVDDCDVSVSVAPVPPRVWAAVSRFVRGNAPLAVAAEGREQSEHLDHLMREDWDAPLVPPGLRWACSCHGAGGCPHALALAEAAATAIDEDPALLLRWRGCTPERAEEGRLTVDADEPDEPVVQDEQAWVGRPLPAARPVRPLPAGAVLKRLGPSGVLAGGQDLADVLQRAYQAFSPGDESSPSLHSAPPDG